MPTLTQSRLFVKGLDGVWRGMIRGTAYNSPVRRCQESTQTLILIERGFLLTLSCKAAELDANITGVAGYPSQSFHAVFFGPSSAGVLASTCGGTFSLQQQGDKHQPPLPLLPRGLSPPTADSIQYDKRSTVFSNCRASISQPSRAAKL